MKAGQGDTDAGLCERCRLSARITNDRGTVFYLCRQSEIDKRFARYPRLPVSECNAFTPLSPDPQEDTRNTLS